MNKKLQFMLSDYRSNIPQIWDFRAHEIYTRWKNEKGDFEVLKDALSTIDHSSLLDIGYGYGRLAPLYRNIPCAVGMDISLNMLKLSKTQTHNNLINILLGDIRAMPFKDNCFKCLISVRTLNHIHPKDFPAVEIEISRVCRDVVILLESDKKVPDAKYEFEHDYDNFLYNKFEQSKKQLEDNVYLRMFYRKDK